MVTDDDDVEVLRVFLEEVREHLDGIEGDLLRLESEEAIDQALVNKIFRAVHSVKGGAGFFGLVSIKTLAHAMENILGAMQRGTLRPSSAVIGPLLSAADVLVDMLNAVGTEEERDVRGLVSQLEAVGAARPVPASADVMAPASELEAAPLAAPAKSAEPTAANADTHATATRPVPSPPAAQGATPAAPVAPRSEGQAQVSAATGRAPESSIRVHTETLDRLMTLAGELVLTRNQLLQSQDTNPGGVSEATQRIDYITTELQDAIMSTRMQSIGIVFQKFRRVVRDLAKSLDKEVDLVIEGEDVEIDRSIVEAVGDPLTHLVRNALDHGIEKPNIREGVGKPKRGTLRISALHKAGQVIIEIADDGAGIDPARVRAKALEVGLLSSDQLATMSDGNIIKLIFRPGFSTATEVTEVSGRGVGMDVVHSNLARIGGVVDVQSTAGKGTTMRIKLPLTLAIIPCLLVTEEREYFAIPQANLVELHRIPAAEVKRKIKKFGEVLVLRLRGELIPLIRLRDTLGMEGPSFESDAGERQPDRRQTGYDRRHSEGPGTSGPERNFERRSNQDRRHAHQGAVNIAIVASGDAHYGLIVESLQDSLEIVVKPLGRHLRHCASYAGATILGDGSLALILDVAAIGQRLQSAEASQALAKARLDARRTTVARDRMTLLLVENSGNELLAVPLGIVERIEHVSRTSIQSVGGKRTLTYRGKNLPMLGIEEVVALDPCRQRDDLYAVVYRSHEREVGLVVSEVVDIIDSEAELDELTHRQAGVFGSLLVDDQVALLLDIHGIARACLGIPEPVRASAPSRKATVLVVEDSRFFRDRISEFCRDAGYEVLLAEDGLEGLALAQQRADSLDLIITDIEMPNLDGFEMARRLRTEAHLRDLPIVAVTSLMGEEAEERGRQVGITEYLIKLDRDRLMERVGAYISARGQRPTEGAA